MFKYYVYPWKQSSRSARALAQALGGKVLRREGSNFLGPSSTRKVINWGASDCPYESLNTAVRIEIFSNKLTSFSWWKNEEDGPRLPRWTTLKAEANWKQGIVARTILTGHSGAGIVIKDFEHRDELPDAPLYVEYMPKDAEYRVHVFDGEVIDVQRKVRDPEKEPSDWKVRSHQNGFIFTRRDSQGVLHSESCPPDVRIQAQKALGSSGLAFGGVDVLFNAKRDKAYVIEANTAVGMENSTVTVYRDAIRKYYES